MAVRKLVKTRKVKPRKEAGASFANTHTVRKLEYRYRDFPSSRSDPNGYFEVHEIIGTTRSGHKFHMSFFSDKKLKWPSGIAVRRTRKQS